MNYSWGQIRLLLQQFAGPGVSLDTIDQAINSRYALILNRMNWQGLEVKGMLQTAMAYRTGTIAVTQGSNAVTGTGTVWTSAMNGQQLLLWFGAPYTVTILSNTSLTLDRPFEGATNAAAAYWLGQAVYQLPDDCRNLRAILSPWTGLAIPEMDELQFAQMEGAPIIDGPVVSYIPQPDGVDAESGNTVRQIMLWPLPSWPRGYPILYEQSAEGFDGTSTTDGPLDFALVPLLDGCKANLCRDAGKLDQMAAFEAAYEAQMLGLLHVEASQKPYLKPRMAGVYTRHRIRRVIRGLGDNTFRDF